MIGAHSTRLIEWDERREWSRFVLLIEPFIACLFLFLVGASLAVSHSVALARGIPASTWLRKQTLRALPLWALSCLFYTLEEGFQFPDALFLSGILATIAYTILLVMLLVAAPRAGWLLALAVAALYGAQLRLDAAGIHWFVVNAGNSPVLPLSIFALLGAWVAIVTEGRRWAAPALAVAAAAGLAWLVWRHGFEALFSKPLGRYETARSFFSGPPQARIEKSIPYYNLRPILVPVVLSLILLFQAGLGLIRPLLDRAAKWLFPMGRHSLNAYILHLSFLAIFIVAAHNNRRPLGKTWQGDAVTLSAIGLCYAFTLGREFAEARWKKKRLS
jgi:uncharacterized membrane protein